MRRLLLFPALLSAHAYAQDASVASEARERLSDRADAEAAAVDSAAESTDESSGSITAPESSVDETPGVDPRDAFQVSDEPASANANAPETYTVKPGDTLWNLSQRFLNNPWYWPKIWAYNPDVDNPNWIRPGTQLRFYPGGEVVTDERFEDAEVEEENNFDELARFEKGKGLTDRLRDLAGLAAGESRREAFIPKEKIDESGQILNSPEEKKWIAEQDRVYVKLKKGGPGDRLQIFRLAREVRHPVTGAVLGRLVTLVGELVVDQQGREQSVATVTATWDTIERGDYVAVLDKIVPAIKRVTNGRALKGYVVEPSLAEAKTYAAGDMYSLIDKGETEGVQVGNLLTVVRTGDPYTQQYSGMPDEDIGQLLVVDTFKNASTVLVLRSSRELLRGDRFELRAE